jgi:hypothetical protein
MSGSTQPVTQTWRATEPRYPPHGISYPVQIARPHTVGARGVIGGVGERGSHRDGIQCVEMTGDRHGDNNH